jgi:very-short-patch-repair endonuclease
MQRLLLRGYRVQGQVGSLGYRIDMVVEGADRRRLAIECDGDMYHGPQHWRDDMRRQRVLERVGWRFWRCFASSFYRDPDGVMNDLFELLTRMGIEPAGGLETETIDRRLTERRTIELPKDEPLLPTMLDDIGAGALVAIVTEDGIATDGTVALGDKVVLLFGDTQKRLSARLTDGANSVENGRLAVTSALGKAICGAEEGAEIEFVDGGRTCTVLIESVEKAVLNVEQPLRMNGSEAPSPAT